MSHAMPLKAILHADICHTYVVAYLSRQQVSKGGALIKIFRLRRKIRRKMSRLARKRKKKSSNEMHEGMRNCCAIN